MIRSSSTRKIIQRRSATCAHRLDIGLERACATVCPTEAILVGDLNDPASQVSRVIGRDAVQVRRPETETRPGVYYKGARQATLDPVAARRPDGRLFASVCLGPDGAPGGEGADRVAGFWRVIGISPPAEPDHLSSLLSLYASLGQAAAGSTRAATAVALARAQAALLWEHLWP